MGGNAYFELNKINYRNDQKRRQDRGDYIHDFTQNSPLKNYTLQHDHERQKKLEEIE